MANKNINVELFKRYAPSKKLEIVKALSDEEVLNTTSATVARIVKEVGESGYSYRRNAKTGKTEKVKTRNKSLYIYSARRKGNNWNSNVIGLEWRKQKLFVNVYVQMDSTDTNVSVPYLTFFARGEYRGKCSEMNRYGDEVPRYFTYDTKDKVKVLRSFLLEYVYTKYADKI